MHNYLKVIGFSSVRKRSEEKLLLKKAGEMAGREIFFPVEEDGEQVILETCYDHSCPYGIRMVGEYDEEGHFRLQSYFPYAQSDIMSMQDECNITKALDTEYMNGCCDDYRLGMSLIFFISNYYDIIRYKNQHEGQQPEIKAVCLTGLCSEAKVLLPVAKTTEQKEESVQASKQRMTWLKAAKGGDAEAIESLTIDDMNLYNEVTKRIMSEDLYTVIDTYFIPTGVECDQYQLMGEILSCRDMKNPVTGETFYCMTVCTNDMELTIYVNREHLLGIPKEGMRIKCDLWLQGEVVLREEVNE